MDVVIWLKYCAPTLLEHGDDYGGGVARASVEIARLLDGKIDVSVYGRGKGRQRISPNVFFHGIPANSELEYVKKSMKVLPEADILHCMSHTYFYFFDDKPWKTLLHVHGDSLPLFWSSFGRQAVGNLPYTRREEEFIRKRLENIKRWGGNSFEGIDRIVACSEYISDICQRRFPEKFVEVIYNPITVVEGDRVRKDFILFVGALTAGKGIDALLETARILEEKRVETPIYVIGSTRQRRPCEDRFWREEFRERKNVFFLGHKTHRKVLEYMGEASVGFIPSQNEGLPYVALEFQSVGTPVVASNVCGLPEAVDGGVSGFLVPPNPNQFAEKIVHLLGDPSLRRKMGQAGRMFVGKKFSAEKISSQYLRLYSRIMKE